MTIEYDSTKKDYLNFYKTFYIEKIKRRILRIISILLFFCLILSYGSNTWIIKCLSVLGFFLIYIFFQFLLPYFISLNRFLKQFNSDSSLLGHKKLSTYEDGIHFENSEKNVDLLWESFFSIDTIDKYIKIILADGKSVIIIPKNSFKEDAEYYNFLGIVQKGINNFKSSENKVIHKGTAAPPLALGLVCLIPFWGGLFGIALILLGYLKFKSKGLIIIGSIGVILNIGFYLYIYNHPDFSLFSNTNETIKRFSQNQLNNLVKDIEFYKVQHGDYPDSLEQLLENQTNISIEDPLRNTDKNKTNPKTYNYKKIGSHYYLFSSGFDGIPNTKDDFYPEVKKAKNSNIGLLIKQ